jgi:hypothetical protein
MHPSKVPHGILFHLHGDCLGQFPGWVLAGPNYDVTLSDTLTQVQTAKVRNATDTRVLNYYVTLSHGSNLFALPCHIHCSSGKQRQGQGTVGWARLSKFNPAASGIILQ